MSTRSRIGIRESDGKISSIYCHSDGYLSCNGRILLNDYQDESKIRQLINLGDISILDQNIGVEIPFEDYNLRKANRQVLAFKRDRNEADTEPEIHSDRNWPDTDWQYLYLWENGEWKFLTTKHSPPSWDLLTEEAIQEEIDSRRR